MIRDIDVDALNIHFASITPMDDTVKANTLHVIRSLPSPSTTPFLFELITPAQVKKNILAIKSDAAGIDGINRKLLLLPLKVLAPVITHIFNFSLSTNSFPSAWRIARIIPIPKSKDPKSFSQYRPISILPFLSKVLERIVSEQLNQYLLENRILSQFQSGFRSGHSTVTALIKVCDDIRFNMEKQNLTIIALLDFSNAFNTVDTDLLIAVLQSINISSEATGWFRNYLSNRRQYVQANDKSSSSCSLSAGVPQGGVLSPLLFSIFINTVSQTLSSSFHLYADDLQIYLAALSSDMDKTICKFNEDLHNISVWSKSYGLTINPSKSQVSIIGSSKQLKKLDLKRLPSIQLSGVDLSLSASIRNLGIILDNSLSWSAQIAEISRRLFASIGSLKRYKHFLPVKTKTTLAHSLLLPILDYADSCYPDLSEEQLNKLERLQNLCIRFIYGLRKFDHVSDHRRQLGWLPIRHRRNFRMLTLLYSILYNPLSPAYLRDRFCFLGSDSISRLELRSRSDNLLKLPTCHTQFYSNSFTVKSAILWNELPSEIRHSKSLNIFKNRLKEYLLNL